MSNKDNKFRPSAGYIVSVHQNILGIRSVAQELDMFPDVLASAMEKAGFQFIPDPFDLSADAVKVIKKQDELGMTGLKVVKNESDSNPGTDRETTV